MNVNWGKLQRQQDESNPDCPWLDEESSWHDKQRENEEYQAEVEEE